MLRPGGRLAIAGAGLRVEATTTDPDRFLSEQAVNASRTFGVHSVSVLAITPEGT